MVCHVRFRDEPNPAPILVASQWAAMRLILGRFKISPRFVGSRFKAIPRRCERREFLSRSPAGALGPYQAFLTFTGNPCLTTAPDTQSIQTLSFAGRVGSAKPRALRFTPLPCCGLAWVGWPSTLWATVPSCL